MGMVNTVGLVLHPARDCNSALFELLAWASKRKVTVLTLEEEARPGTRPGRGRRPGGSGRPLRPHGQPGW